MFKSLSNQLQKITQSFGRQVFINETNIEEGLQEIRRSLLEADVAFACSKRAHERCFQACFGARGAR